MAGPRVGKGQAGLSCRTGCLPRPTKCTLTFNRGRRGAPTTLLQRPTPVRPYAHESSNRAWRIVRRRARRPELLRQDVLCRLTELVELEPATLEVLDGPLVKVDQSLQFAVVE